MTTIKLITLLQKSLKEEGNKQVQIYDRHGEEIQATKLETSITHKSNGKVLERLYLSE